MLDNSKNFYYTVLAMKYQVKQKRDYLTDQTVYSVQEFIGNDYCGHWHEVDWALSLTGASQIVKRLKRR